MTFIEYQSSMGRLLEFRPNLLPIVWAQVFAGDGPHGRKLNCRALFSRYFPKAITPKADSLRGYPNFSSEL